MRPKKSAGTVHLLQHSARDARIYEKRIESYVFPGVATLGQAPIHLDDLTNCFVRCVDIRDRLPAEDVFLIAEPVVLSYGEIRHANTKLGWDPSHRLRDTLPLMIGFLRQDPAGFYEENGLTLPDSLSAT